VNGIEASRFGLVRALRMPPRPEPARVSAPESVRIADLSAPKKRALWAWIKANDAALAEWLTSDTLRDFLARWPGASPVLDLAYVRRALH
jgi:hypothetical protein